MGKAFAWLMTWLVLTAFFYVAYGLLSLAVSHSWPSPIRLTSWQIPAGSALAASLPTKQWGGRWLHWVRGPEDTKPTT